MINFSLSFLFFFTNVLFITNTIDDKVVHTRLIHTFCTDQAYDIYNGQFA